MLPLPVPLMRWTWFVCALALGGWIKPFVGTTTFTSAVPQYRTECPAGGCPAIQGAAPAAWDVPAWRIQSSAGTMEPAPLEAVVRVRAGDGSVGSGVLIDVQAAGRGLVLTAAHVAGGGRTGSVEFVGGARRAYARVGLDRTWDLAVLAIDVPAGARRAALAARDAYPRRGNRLTLAGFGSTGRLCAQAGQCLGYCRVGQSPLYQTLVVGAAQARAGDSGGPIFNDRGEVVGIVWGASCGETFGSCTLRIWPLVERVLAECEAEGTSPASDRGAAARTPPPAHAAPSPAQAPAGPKTPNNTPEVPESPMPETSGNKGPACAAGAGQCCGCRCHEIGGEIRAQLALLEAAEEQYRRLISESLSAAEASERSAAELARLSQAVAGVEERLRLLEARLRGKVRFRLRWDPSTGELAPVQP